MHAPDADKGQADEHEAEKDQHGHGGKVSEIYAFHAAPPLPDARAKSLNAYYILFCGFFNGLFVNKWRDIVRCKSAADSVYITLIRNLSPGSRKKEGACP
jgi:hypothetical protein